ncbi:MAG: cytochrome c oxidase subunit II [Bryobacteraceae bacterium]
MGSRLPLFPDQASTFASEVDALYLFLVALTVFFSVLIAGTILYFAIKYRRRSEDERPPTIEGGLALEFTWTIVPFLIAMFIFGWGAQVYFRQFRAPDDATEVWVVGKQWMWKVQHLGGQREINELHVPVGRAVKLIMTSEDVIHDFYVPAFRTKRDVLPNRYSTLWFRPTRTGVFHLFCAEYCGTKHSGMVGSVYVMEPADYQQWLTGGRAEGSLSEQGARLFQDLACDNCHREDGRGRGPRLEGVFGTTVLLDNGQRVTADETYLRESILNPGAKIVSGHQNIMPTFQGLVTEEDLIRLVEYIKSIGPKVEAPPGETAPAAATPTQR